MSQSENSDISTRISQLVKLIHQSDPNKTKSILDKLEQTLKEADCTTLQSESQTISSEINGSIPNVINLQNNSHDDLISPSLLEGSLPALSKHSDTENAAKNIKQNIDDTILNNSLVTGEKKRLDSFSFEFSPLRNSFDCMFPSNNQNDDDVIMCGETLVHKEKCNKCGGHKPSLNSSSQTENSIKSYSNSPILDRKDSPVIIEIEDSDSSNLVNLPLIKNDIQSDAFISEQNTQNSIEDGFTSNGQQSNEDDIFNDNHCLINENGQTNTINNDSDYNANINDNDTENISIGKNQMNENKSSERFPNSSISSEDIDSYDNVDYKKKRDTNSEDVKIKSLNVSINRKFSTHNSPLNSESNQLKFPVEENMNKDNNTNGNQTEMEENNQINLKNKEDPLINSINEELYDELIEKSVFEDNCNFDFELGAELTIKNSTNSNDIGNEQGVYEISLFNNPERLETDYPIETDYSIETEYPIETEYSIETEYPTTEIPTSSNAITVECKTCLNSLTVSDTRLVVRHPFLGVLICRRCNDFLNSGKFQIEEGKEIYCCWCGDGGEIANCDLCPKSICKTCLDKNLGTSVWENIIEDETTPWKCYCCDPSPIQHLIDECNSVLGVKKNDKKSQRANSGSSGGKTNTISFKKATIKRRRKSTTKKRDLDLVEKSSTLTSQDDNPKKKSKMEMQERYITIPIFDQDDQSKNNKEDLSVQNVDLETKEEQIPIEVAKEKDLLSPISIEAVIEKADSPKNDEIIFSEPSDPDTDSISFSDPDLLDEDYTIKKQNKRKRKRRNISLNSLKDSSNEDEKRSEELENKQTTRTKRSVKKTNLRSVKKIKSSVFCSSDEDAKQAEILSVSAPLAGNKISSEDELDSVIPNVKLDNCEYQIKSDGNDEFSSSDISDSELIVRKGKRKGKNKSISEDTEKRKELALKKAAKTITRKNSRKAQLLSESTSESDSEGDEDGEQKKSKRKKIRKLIQDSKLQETTKEAEKEERERLKRLEHRHKQLNESVSLEENNEKSTKSITSPTTPLIEYEDLVLEYEKDSKEPLVKVDESIVKQLKPHQRDGVHFLWDCVAESLEMLKSPGSGALLAHCMGLGKTLQLIALIHTLLNHSEANIEKIIILTPVNVLYNWKSEFDKWVPNKDYYIFTLESKDDQKKRIRLMEEWYSIGGVMLCGYDMFRNFCLGKNIKTKKKKLRILEILCDPGPDLVVCDEGHVMRNSKSGLSKTLANIKTRRRIVLTGTPLQNNLSEYYCMTNFIKPNLLGSIVEFTNRFVNPITNGQHADSTRSDVMIMKQRSHVLHEKLSGCVQRQDYTALTKYLPPKNEFIISVRLTPLQIKLYETFMDSFERREIFPMYTILRRVWSHPWILKKDQEFQRVQNERRMILEEDSMEDFIATSSEDEGSDGLPHTSKKKIEVEQRKSGPKRQSCRSAIKRNIDMREDLKKLDDIINIDTSDSSEVDINYEPKINIEQKPQLKVENEGIEGENKFGSDVNEVYSDDNINFYEKEWFDDFIPAEIETQLEQSAKLIFLFELLKETKKLNEKVLVFSQSLQMLDLVEFFLQRPENGDWVKGLHYYRMDGSTSIDTRDVSSSVFNNPDYPDMRLFIISTKAGSLGINLIAANRVVILDASWNPTHDTQSIFRVYRFGQTKPVFIYRLIAKGTMEEKIYDRQVTKESLSLRVVDEQQIGRHFTSGDLADLFLFDGDTLQYSDEDNTNDVKKESFSDDIIIIENNLPSSTSTVCNNNNNINNNNSSNRNNKIDLTKRPKADIILSSLLDKLQPKFVMDYHEHDSLTEHIYSEELTEDEKKEAWENYNFSKEAISKNYVNQVMMDKKAEELQAAQIEQAKMQLALETNSATSSAQNIPPMQFMMASSGSKPNSREDSMHHRIIQKAVGHYQKVIHNYPNFTPAQQKELFETIHNKIQQDYITQQQKQHFRNQQIRQQLSNQINQQMNLTQQKQMYNQYQQHLQNPSQHIPQHQIRPQSHLYATQLQQHHHHQQQQQQIQQQQQLLLLQQQKRAQDIKNQQSNMTNNPHYSLKPHKIRQTVQKLPHTNLIDPPIDLVSSPQNFQLPLTIPTGRMPTASSINNITNTTTGTANSHDKSYPSFIEQNYTQTLNNNNMNNTTVVNIAPSLDTLPTDYSNSDTTAPINTSNNLILQ